MMSFTTDAFILELILSLEDYDGRCDTLMNWFYHLQYAFLSNEAIT
jgi:hypothetical protein